MRLRASVGGGRSREMFFLFVFFLIVISFFKESLLLSFYRGVY